MTNPSPADDAALKSAEEGNTKSDYNQAPKAVPQPGNLNIGVESEQIARGWQHVLGNLQKKDNATMKDFNEEIDTLLVFAGLFSAVLTAFIIEAYQLLEQDQTETSAIILRRISMQLDQTSNEPPISLPSTTFRPSKFIIAVNMLWFMSLLFSLFAALVAILAKQWIHVYSKWDEGPSDLSENKLLLRDLYQQGLTQHHVPEIIGMLPVFLQIALLFFVVGLTMFLWRLEFTLAAIVTSLTVVGISLAFYTIIRPIFDRRCMYKTPLVIFVAAAWDAFVSWKASWDAPRYQESAGSRSYTRWRDHDLVVAKELHKHKSEGERILAQISLIFDIRPPITWSNLEDGTATIGMLELDTTSSNLVKRFMISLLYTTDQKERKYLLHKNSSPLYRVFRRAFPPPNLKLLDNIATLNAMGDNGFLGEQSLIFRSSSEKESTLDKEMNITLALVDHLQIIGPNVSADKDDILWGLHLLCSQLEVLISRCIFEEIDNNLLERVKSKSISIWPTFEMWLRVAVRVAGQDITTIKPRETLLMDCFLSKHESVEDTKSALQAVMRLGHAFPGTAKIDAAIVWRLKLLNEVADTVVKNAQSTILDDAMSELQNLGNMLHYWVGIATNAEVSAAATISSSLILLEALFDLVISYSRSPCSLENLAYALSDAVSFCLSSDGTKLVTGERNGLVCVWDFVGHHIITEMHGHTGGVFSVSFSKDGTRIASGSGDNTIRIWSTESGNELSVMQGHQEWVSKVVFSSSGSKIISGSYDNTAIVWNCATGEALRVLTGHTDALRSVAFSEDELRVATASDDTTVRIWDTDTGLCLNIVKTGQSTGVAHVDFIADSYHFLSRAYMFDSDSKNWEQKYFNAPYYNVVQAPSELEDVDPSLLPPLVIFDARTHYLLCWVPEAKQFRPFLKLPQDVVPSSTSFEFHYTGSMLVFARRGICVGYAVDFSSLVKPSIHIEAPMEPLPFPNLS